MKSEKAISAKDGSNTNLVSELTMKTNSNGESISMSEYTPNQNKFQFNSTPSRRDLLEQTKLSQLPERKPFRLPDFDKTPTNPVAVAAVCADCGGRLDRDDNFQQSIHGCRKCIGIYARIDTTIEESAKRKKRELLEKFTGGAK